MAAHQPRAKAARNTFLNGLCIIWKRSVLGFRYICLSHYADGDIFFYMFLGFVSKQENDKRHTQSKWTLTLTAYTKYKAFCTVNIVFSTPHTISLVAISPMSQTKGRPAMKKHNRQTWKSSIIASLPNAK